MGDYYVHDLSPFLIRFSEHWGIRYYGLAYLAGFLGYYLGLKTFRKRGWSELSDEQVGDLMVWMVAGVLIGGRLGYCFLYDWHRTVADPISVVAFWRGGISGMASHGGIVGALLAMVWFAHRNKLSIWRLADNAAVLAPIGLGLGRVANFINGELWGRPTTVPWAVIFPAADGQPRHPSQLYQAIGEGLILFVVMWWLRSLDRKPGFVSGGFLVVYAINRIVAEFFREPDPQIMYYFGWMTQGQLLSIPLVLAGAVLMVRSWATGPAQPAN
ncbi:MAG: hypothetical protein OHK005_00800 [Candidatus Methylacidiphilales bacterium]